MTVMKDVRSAPGDAGLVDRLRALASERDDYYRARAAREAADRIEALERQVVVLELEIAALRRVIAPTMAREIGL